MEIKFKNGSTMKSIDSEDNKRSNRADELKEFYSKYPDIFIERYFGIELLAYQRVLIRHFCKGKK